MFKKICARSSDIASPGIRSQRTARSGLLFFFALALSPVFPFPAVSDASADELVSASTTSNLVADAGPAMLEIAANFPSFTKATTQIVVNISVNRESKGDFFLEIDTEGELYIRVGDAVALKLKTADDSIVLIRNEKHVPLSALRDVRHTFDERNLIVNILGKTAEKRQTTIELYPLSARPLNVYYPRETSAFINYGLAYSHADPFGFQSFTVTNKVGIRSGDVFFVSDSLYTKTGTNEKFTRLGSNATYEQRGELQWLVLGDQFASSGELGSAVNMGGIGFSKVYKLDPYFITQPLFSLRGVADFPSQAEIYMDGLLVSKQQIPPGSFELKNIYSHGGAHRVDVVLKDPFGNEQKISYPLYFSPQLLREGLHEYRYNAGFLREQYGVASNEYGKPAFSAFHRYGVTSSLNIGARAEGTDGVYNGGISTAFLVPRAGAFTLSLAGSSAYGAKGSAGSFHHTYQQGSFSANLLLREFSRDYATVGSAPAADRTKTEMSLGAGFLLARMGGVSLNYTESETHNGVNTRVTSASYSRGLTKATSLFVTASANRALDTTYGFFVGLNFNLEKNMRGAAQYGRTGNADTETVQIQKDLPIGEGLGYRAALNRSDTGASTAYTFNPSLQYNARYGAYTFGSSIRNSHGKTSESYEVTAAGSLVYAGGFYGLARPVNDSFGIVMVDNVPNATVLNNGQEIGRTGPSGMMVVPTLASYNQNQITLDVKNIPMDYSISGVNAKISPSQWSGSCVSFDARKVQAVTGTLYTIRADKKIPLEYVDISIKVGEREVTSPTGKGGEFYMENSLPDDLSADAVDKQSCRAIAERGKSGGNIIKPGTYQAQVDYEGGKCEFAVTFPDTEDVITDLGEARCVVSEKAGQEMVEVEKKPKGVVPKPKQPVVEVEKEERKSPEEERRSLHLNMIKVYFDDIQAQEARISHTVNPKVIGNYVEKRNHTGAYYRTEQDVLLCEAGLCEQQWTALFNYTDEAGKADTISMTWKQTVFTGITPAGTSKRELLYCLNGVCERLEDATAADKPRTAETGRYHLTWTRSLLVIRRADIMKEINEAGGLVDAY